jgi:hypothetical protein
MLAAAPAVAQAAGQQGPRVDMAEQEPAEEGGIIVSASRISASGFEAPTPTTMKSKGSPVGALPLRSANSLAMMARGRAVPTRCGRLPGMSLFL